MSFFKQEDELLTDTRHWEINDISNGIRCTHTSGGYEDYFEYDEIDAINAFSGKTPMSVLDLLYKLINVTPHTKGFSYGSFNIISKIDRMLSKPKGFIIRPRLLDGNNDIDNKIQNCKESYVSVETLRVTSMRDFLNIITLPYKSNDQLQQVLDTED